MGANGDWERLSGENIYGTARDVTKNLKTKNRN